MCNSFYLLVSCSFFKSNNIIFSHKFQTLQTRNDTNQSMEWCNIRNTSRVPPSFSPSLPLSLPLSNTQHCHHWRIKTRSARILHHFLTSTAALFLWARGVLSTGRPSRREHYIPRVPVSVRCSRSLNFTPLSKCWRGKTNDILPKV